MSLWAPFRSPYRVIQDEINHVRYPLPRALVRGVVATLLSLGALGGVWALILWR